MPDSDSAHADRLVEFDEADEFELVGRGAEPSPPRLPSWLVNPASDSALLPHACTQMRHAVDDITLPVSYTAKFRQYSIDYDDGGTSTQLIAFCPFCGATLPPNLRDRWLTTLRRAGIEPWDDSVPAAYQSDQWWRDAGL